MDRTDTKRPNGQAPHAPSQCSLEPARRVARRALREQDEHVACLKPSHCKHECAGRGRIEPLDVVDRNDDGCRRSEDLQHVAHAECDSAVIDRAKRTVTIGTAPAAYLSSNRSRFTLPSAKSAASGTAINATTNLVSLRQRRPSRARPPRRTSGQSAAICAIVRSA